MIVYTSQHLTIPCPTLIRSNCINRHTNGASQAVVRKTDSLLRQKGGLDEVSGSN